ncbi:MAG: cytochrome b/b6 domain-containing protein [Paracoccaceae bacterium]
MNLKSSATRYGIFPILIHWLSVFLIFGLLFSGNRAASMTDQVAKAQLLSLHAPIGSFIGLLTLIRIVWWIFIDKKPEPVSGMPYLQELCARAVHLMLYGVIILSAASGIAMFALSGAGPIIAGWVDAPLPDFTKYPPRIGHTIGAWTLVTLLIFHAGAAFFHQFVKKDGLLKRMWFTG